MPLSLPATDRSKCVVWDPLDADQTVEAVEKIKKLKDRGFTQRENSPGKAVLYPPELDENTFLFRVLTENGDDILTWDRRFKEQIDEARQKFEGYLQRGYTAFASRNGQRGAKLDSFDELREQVIMAHGSAILVPRSHPG